MQLDFREATPADVDQIVALVRSAYRGEQSRRGWTTEADLLDDQRIDAAGVGAKIAPPERMVLLGHAAGELLACCELAGAADGIWHFGLFAVRPEHQAAGIGRQLLAEAERRAAAGGARAIGLEVVHPRPELLAWYVRRGYRLTGETRPFPYQELIGGSAPRPGLYFDVMVKQLRAEPRAPAAR